MAITGSLSTIRNQAPRHPYFEKAFAYIDVLVKPGSEANRRLLGVALNTSNREDLGDGIFALEQAYLTKTPEEGRWESHRKFIDIQVVVSGDEYIGVCEINRLSVAEDVTPGKDLIFYQATSEGSSIRLKSGEAAILFPPDGHLPGLRTTQQNTVRKAVIKIPVL